MTYTLFFDILKVSLLCFFLNIPFGIIRVRFKKFSVGWFLCIHTPIPVVAIVRRALGFTWYYIPIFLVFSVLGQIVGKKIAEHYAKRHHTHTVEELSIAEKEKFSKNNSSTETE